jgi:DNA-binding response OmpR family regulator
MKRRILLVDDEVAVLLTLKAVLEISGFDVDTAASAREGKSKLRTHEYHMVITDMRMESEASGAEVIQAARLASYHPAVALLTAYPLAEEDWQSMGADKMLVKPTHTRILLEQIEKMLASHEAKLKIWSTPAPRVPVAGAVAAAPSKAAKGKTTAKKATGRIVKKSPVRAKKSAATRAATRAAKTTKR